MRDTILALAERQGVAYRPTRLEGSAADAARLADAEVAAGAVEDLLQAILRAGVLDDAAMMRLQLDYTRERTTAEAVRSGRDSLVRLTRRAGPACRDGAALRPSPWRDCGPQARS